MPSVLADGGKRWGRGAEAVSSWKVQPSWATNFRFTRPGTLAVSLHIADNAVFGTEQPLFEECSWQVGLGGVTVTFLMVIGVAAPTDPFWLVPWCVHLCG